MAVLERKLASQLDARGAGASDNNVLGRRDTGARLAEQSDNLVICASRFPGDLGGGSRTGACGQDEMIIRDGPDAGAVEWRDSYRLGSEICRIGGPNDELVPG